MFAVPAEETVAGISGLDVVRGP